MFPGYAKIAGDPVQFRRVCTDATAAILLVVLPASFAVAILAGPIVRVLLGVQWHEAAPVIRILAFAGAVTAITSNNVAAYMALGRPRLATAIYVARLVFFVVLALPFVASLDINAVAWCELGAALGSLLVSLPILFRIVKVRAADYLATIWRPFASSVVASGAVYMLLGLAEETSDLATAIARLAVGLPAGLLFYVAALVMLWRLAGRPATVEVEIVRQLHAGLATRFARFRAGNG